MRLAKGRLALVAALVGSALAILNVPIPGQAQSSSLRVKVPFEFQVGNQKLPAGTYTVHMRGQAIQISDVNGHSAVAISNAVAKSPSALDNSLVFNRYGDVCFLSAVRWNGYPTAREVLKSSTEIELAKLHPIPSVLTAGITR